MLFALTESELLMTVIGVYTTLAGLWLLYWLVERLASPGGKNRKVGEPAGVMHRNSDTAAERYGPAIVQAETSGELRHHVFALDGETEEPINLASESVSHRGEIERLRSELCAVADQSSFTKSRLETLQIEVEALKLSLIEKLVKLESSSATERVVEADPPILSIFDAKLASYDADWTTVDPELGIVIAKRPHDADDLTRIWGVGEVYQTQLNEHGVYYFRQIADWNDRNVEKFNELLSFKGRIEREDWVGQAKQFLGEPVRREAA